MRHDRPGSMTDPAAVTVADLLAAHTRTLAAAGLATAEADVLLLAEDALGIDRRSLRTTKVADPVALAALADLVSRRARHEPVQLLVGRTWFRLIELLCRPGVFIPRPETEVVAGLAVAAARARATSPLVVEPCTGTGAIALSVAAEVPGARVVATDTNEAAVDLALANLGRVEAGRAGVPGLADGATCSIRAGDLLDPVGPAMRGHVDVLVANPPYLPTADLAGLPADVADHDPHDALFAGSDGLEIVDRLLIEAASWLAPGGAVVLEIDPRRSPATLEHAAAVGLVGGRIERDLTGTDRALVAMRP